MDVVAEQSLNREKKGHLCDDEQGVPELVLHKLARGGLRSTSSSTTAGDERIEKGEERVSENGRE
jgi:hypothetical protein